MLHYLSPSPVYDVLGPKATPQAVAAWNKQHGYDRPESPQFLTYLGQHRAPQLRLLLQAEPVASTRSSRRTPAAAPTCRASALLLSLLIAIPLGIAQAVKRNSIGDYTVTTLNFVLYSMPSFFLGLILIQFFALDLGHLSADGQRPRSRRPGRRSPTRSSCSLPIVTLARDQRRVVQPVHALLGAGQPRPGLHPAGARQGPVRASRAVPPPAPQRLPADDHAGRPVDPGAARRQPADRGRCSTTRGSGCCSSTRSATRTTTILLAYTILGGILTVLGNLVADIAITVADPRVRLD